MPQVKNKYENAPVIKRRLKFLTKEEEKFSESLIENFSSNNYNFYGKYEKFYALAEYYLNKSKDTKIARAYSIFTNLYQHSWYLNLDLYQRVSRKLYHIYSGKYPALIKQNDLKIEFNLEIANNYLHNASKEFFMKCKQDFPKMKWYFNQAIIRYTLEELEIYFSPEIVFESEENFGFFQNIFDSADYGKDENIKQKINELYITVSQYELDFSRKNTI